MNTNDRNSTQKSQKPIEIHITGSSNIVNTQNINAQYDNNAINKIIKCTFKNQIIQEQNNKTNSQIHIYIYIHRKCT